MKWPKKLRVARLKGAEDVRYILPATAESFDDEDERIYVLAPKRKAKKKPEGSGK